MQHRHGDLDTRPLFGGVHVHRDAAAVVFYGDRVVAVQSDVDARAKSCQRFVDRVVDHFVDQVMKSALAGGADIHARPFADRFQSLEDLNLTRGIIRLRWLLFGHFSRVVWRLKISIFLLPPSPLQVAETHSPAWVSIKITGPAFGTGFSKSFPAPDPHSAGARFRLPSGSAP